MFTLYSNFSDLAGLPLKAYSVKFSLDRLKPGVDNIRHDVLLSPDLSKSVSKLIYQLFLKHAKAKKILNIDTTTSLVTERDEFKHFCRDVLHAAINQAKSSSETQIDLLAQLAIIKKLAKEIPRQYIKLIENINDNVRRFRTTSSKGLNQYIKIKEKLSEIQQDKKFIILDVAAELFGYLIDVQHENITEMRESVLGPETILPDDVFSNPIIHVENPFEDLFMMDEYILIGHRYEFLLPDEQSPQEKPIIHHVVIKADLRDSTHITLKMKEKGLNPASFFSLNFFVPITSILFDYSAEKVFIEGDAIILAISEREDTPEDWYCVARACGIAMKILQIVQKYNLQSEKYKLPILELGIGISFNNSPPTFLFDESNRIMISPAINLADRMSKCSKPLSQKISNLKFLFNLYVFQRASENYAAIQTDNVLLRHNVNGIELNAAGFEKLSREIDLKSTECHIPELQSEKIKVHTGKFPTVSGKYHRLVIREDLISEISPNDISILKKTEKKYYEVCTHPLLFEHIEKL